MCLAGTGASFIGRERIFEGACFWFSLLLFQFFSSTLDFGSFFEFEIVDSSFFLSNPLIQEEWRLSIFSMREKDRERVIMCESR